MNRYFFEIHSGNDREAPGCDKFTAKALSYIKTKLKPGAINILDIGCGPGAQTLQLASELPDAFITAIDTHQPFINRLSITAEKRGFAGRISAVNMSMNAMNFANENFDLIWSEGAIYNLGFDAGLKECRRLLKPGGFAAISEAAWLKSNVPEECREFWSECYPAMRTVNENIEAIQKAGFELIANFTLPGYAWLDNYYAPLKLRAAEMLKNNAGIAEAKAAFDAEMYEIAIYEKYGKYYGYEFFVIRRK